MSVHNKAYQFRIYPNQQQKVLLAKTFGSVRLVYNHFLDRKIKVYQQTQKNISYQQCAADLAAFKKENDFLKEVDSIALQQSLRHLDTAYQNFFRNPKTGFPKFKSKKKGHKSYTTVFVNGNIRLENGCLTIPKVKAVKIKQHRNIPDGYKLKSVTISQTPSGKYFASVLFEYEKEIQPVPPKNVVGLDFSMKELYVSSDNTFGNYPGFYRKAQQKLARAQRKLSKCTYGSKRYYKQKHKAALLHEKIANQRKDFLHKTSREIANSYDAVCIENLNMKAMSQALKFGKSVADNGWGMFAAYLTYKLQELGKQLVKIDKWFPSSKTCSCCGAIKQSLSLSDRTYICDCGAILDRDINAAINIKREGMKLLSSV